VSVAGRRQLATLGVCYEQLANQVVLMGVQRDGNRCALNRYCRESGPEHPSYRVAITHFKKYHAQL